MKRKKLKRVFKQFVDEITAVGDRLAEAGRSAPPLTKSMRHAELRFDYDGDEDATGRQLNAFERQFDEIERRCAVTFVFRETGSNYSASLNRLGLRSLAPRICS